MATVAQVHNRHDYGSEKAERLDYLFDLYGRMTQVADRYPCGSEMSEIAWNRSSRIWLAYKEALAGIHDKLAAQNEAARVVNEERGRWEDAMYDDYMATVDDASGRGGW